MSTGYKLSEKYGCYFLTFQPLGSGDVFKPKNIVVRAGEFTGYLFFIP